MGFRPTNQSDRPIFASVTKFPDNGDATLNRAKRYLQNGTYKTGGETCDTASKRTRFRHQKGYVLVDLEHQCEYGREK